MNYFDVKEIEDSRDDKGKSLDGADYEYVVSELKRLDEPIVAWHASHPDVDDYFSESSGIYNSGYCFVNDEFALLAYDWVEGPRDEPRNLNFYHFASGCDITWYKHWARATYAHGAQTFDIIENRKLADIVNACIASLKSTDENQWEYTGRGAGGFY